MKLTAAGKGIEVVKQGTQVRVVATEKGAIPEGERPALLEIFGGYEWKGQTQANLLRKCTRMRCELDPALRMPATWTYQAFLVGASGRVLAKSRIVKVQWITRGPTASAP